MEFNWKDHISVNPNICHGRSCIKGIRIWVSPILDLLASGSTNDEIMHEYPQLKIEDIFTCIAFSAEVAAFRIKGG